MSKAFHEALANADRKVREVSVAAGKLARSVDIMVAEMKNKDEQLAAIKDAGKWVINCSHGVGRAGGAPEPGEWEHAIAIDALAAAIDATESEE
jgi:hypothetical protein